MSTDFQITRDELIALAEKCGVMELVNFDSDSIAYFNPANSRDDAALVESAIEKAGLWDEYEGRLAHYWGWNETDLHDLNKFFIRLTPAHRTLAALLAFGIRTKS